MSDRPIHADPAGARPHAETKSGPSAPVAPNFNRPTASRRTQWLALVLALGVLGGGAFFLRSRAAQPEAPAAAAPAPKPQPVVTVTTAAAAFAPLVRSLEVTGSVSAWDPLSIGSEAAGLRIETVNVEEGDRVRRGQLLATLNDSVLQAQLTQARARLASAEVTIRQRRAALTKAQATYREALANQRRYEELSRQGAISKQEALARQTVAESAAADLENARLAVDAAVGAAAENRAQVAQFEAQIAQTRIVAPDDGLVSRRDAHIGDIVSAGKTLFTMVRDSRLELRAQVPEVDLPKIQPGQIVRVTSDADARLSVNGRVRQISPQVDERTRLGTVRIDVPSVNGMRPGMFVRGQVALGERRAIVVPSQAVLTRDEGAQVFVLSGEQAMARPVVAGARSGDRVEIVSGLKPGEKVIVAGAGYLKDGDYVRLPKAGDVQ